MKSKNIRKNITQSQRDTQAQGAESNLSFIQLANEARQPDTDSGLMVKKNFSQQAKLTQDFYSHLFLLLSVFSFISEESSLGKRMGN